MHMHTSCCDFLFLPLFLPLFLSLSFNPFLPSLPSSQSHNLPLSHLLTHPITHSLIHSFILSLPPLTQLHTPDDMVAIYYTSGTTGNPKGVIVTNRNVVSNVAGVYRHFVSTSVTCNLTSSVHSLKRRL